MPPHGLSHCPDCPSLEELERFVAGELRDPRMRAKVAICEACAQEAENIRDNLAFIEQLGDLTDGSGGARTLRQDYPVDLEGYAILGEIHRGGQGIVYRARQLGANRIVAVKVLLQGAFATSHQRRRFEREVELVARLQHPHIVAVYDSGIHRDRYYYVMEYISGRPFIQAFQPGPSHARDVLGVMIQVCEAVDYAHQRGVLHRDLKPGNILIDERGRPHVVDFGLGKDIEGHTADGRSVTLSEPGALLGTLAYMSPEQALGQADQLSVRTDVYSLGAILHELLTGRPPCGVDGPLHEVLNRIAYENPPRLSSSDRRLDADLDAIVLKALEKDPRDRYATAGDFGADLRRYLGCETIVARRAGWPTRARRWCKRNRRLAAVLAGSSLLLVIITSGAFIRIRGERDRALEAERRYQAKAISAQRTSDFLVDVFMSVDPFTSVGRSITLEELLDKARGRLDEFHDEPLEKANLLNSIGAVYKNIGRHDIARSMLEEALEIRRRLRGEDHPDVATTLNNLGGLEHALGEFQGAEEHFRQAVAILERTPAPDLHELAQSHQNLGAVLRMMHEHGDAELHLQEALAIRSSMPDGKPERVAHCMRELNRLYRDTGDYEAAERYLHEALDGYRTALGEENLWVAGSYFDAGWLAYLQEDHDAAETWGRRAIELQRQTLPTGHRDLVPSLVLLSLVLMERGEAIEAEPLLSEILDIRRATLPPDHWLTAYSESALGACYVAQGRFEEAEPLLIHGYQQLAAQLGSTHRRTGEAIVRLIDLYEGWSKPDLAAEYRDLLKDVIQQ